MAYEIDAEDVLRNVSEAWSAFALRNGGEQIVADRVLGRSLWDFVSGEDTRQVYRDLLRRVRAGREARFRYRCDAPGERRHMEMVMRPASNGRVSFESITLRTEPREAPASRPGTSLVSVCGWCNRWNVDGEWAEVEEALSRLDVFTSAATPGMSHGICRGCFERVMTTSVAGGPNAVD